jgi:hypothetical protein
MWPANKAIETAGITSISPIIPNERGLGYAVNLPFNNNKLHGPSKTIKRNKKSIKSFVTQCCVGSFLF